MPTIPFPNVADLPGVPALPRSQNIPVGITVSLGVVETLLEQSQSSAIQWGIFDSNGNQLGATSQSGNSLLQLLASTAGLNPVLSTNAFEFTKETHVSDFQVEQGGFATYNKVVMPATPTVTLALTGAVSDRTAFLNAVDAACISTGLYSIYTPELNYYNYNLMRYRLIRRPDRGANLIMVEIDLKEVREVSATYSTVVTPIKQPQDPGSTPATNSGQVQPTTTDTSTLKSLLTTLGGML
jgi:hypothetical protein